MGPREMTAANFDFQNQPPVPQAGSYMNRGGNQAVGGGPGLSDLIKRIQWEQMMQQAMQGAGDMVGGAADAAMGNPMVQDAMNSPAMQQGMAMGNDVMGAIGGAADAAAPYIDAAGVDLGRAGDAIGGMAGGAADAIGGAIQQAPGMAQQGADELMALIQQLEMEQMMQQAGQGIGDAYSGAKGMAADALGVKGGMENRQRQEPSLMDVLSGAGSAIGF